jgi:hypothetical protein
LYEKALATVPQGHYAKKHFDRKLSLALLHLLPVKPLDAAEVPQYDRKSFQKHRKALCELFMSSICIHLANENGTIETTQFPNITKPFCRNIELSDTSMLIYRFTLVFVQYIIPVCVISFVYIQVSLIDHPALHLC